MVIKTIKFQKAFCTYILTPRRRTCRVVDLKLPGRSVPQTTNSSAGLLFRVGCWRAVRVVVTKTPAEEV